MVGDRRLRRWFVVAHVLLNVAAVLVAADKAVGIVRGPRVISADNGTGVLALSRDGGTLYAADYWGNRDDYGSTVTRISLSSGKATGRYKVGTAPAQIVLAGGGSRLYAEHDPTFGDGAIVSVNLSDGVAGPAIRLPGAVASIVASPDGRTLYASTDKGIVPVDVATGKVGVPIADPGGPGILAVSRDGKTLYTASGDLQGMSSDMVYPVDAAMGKPGTPIRVAHSPAGMTMSPDGRSLFVLGNDNDGEDDEDNPRKHSLTIIDPATGRVRKEISLVSTPTDMAVSPDSRTLYIRNDDTTVTSVDTATGTLGPAYRTNGFFDADPPGPDSCFCGGASSMVVSPDGRILYASNGRGVAIIPLS